jgi:hypothetical protein
MRFEEEIRGASTRPATEAATSPVDPQLQQALTTMVGVIYLDNTKPPLTTQPATQP